MAVLSGTQETWFLGTLGGVFRSSDGGQTWLALTDDQPAPFMRKVVVRAGAPTAIFAGTGLGFITGTDPTKSAGVLRSLQNGDPGSWCKIGPPWPPGTSNSQSVVEIYSIQLSQAGKLYAATNRGLFRLNNPAESNCNLVAWTSLSQPSNPTGPPKRADGSPEAVSNVLVSPWNANVLYASIFGSPSGNNGVYRSTNDGATWVPISTGLPADNRVDYMAIAPVAGLSNWDRLYAGVQAVSHPAVGLCPSGGHRLYKGYHSASTFFGWSRLTMTRQCTTKAECCDDGDCSCTSGWCNPSPDCDGAMRSLAASPADDQVVVVGTPHLYRSTDAAGPGRFMQYGRTVLHPDINDVTFAADGIAAYIGTDGGLWRSPNLGDRLTTPTFTNVNGDMENILFYHGALGASNHALSVGGTQDNGHIKGGNPLSWYQINGGDGYGTIIDPFDYNIIYQSDLGGSALTRSTDGGTTSSSITANPSCSFPTPLTYAAFPVGLDPTDNRVMVAFSSYDKQVYRTLNANAVNPNDVCWNSITSVPFGGVDLLVLVVAPTAESPSNLIFGGSCQFGVWRTTDASNWTYSTTGLPPRCVNTLVVQPGQVCTGASCTLYAGFDGSSGGHVFRSTDAGQTWQDISGNLPDLPVRTIAAHPTNPNVIYVGMEFGIYQGTFDGSSWSWGTFVSGFPPAGDVVRLAAHPESGLLRAWTYGRSAWETQIFPIPDPDQKVNTVSGVTGTMHNSTRISSNAAAQNYAVAWIDDRLGANNWHVYYRGYKYDANGQPVPMGTDVKVDDGSVHVTQGVSISGHPTQVGFPYYDSRVAWHDDRLNPGVNWHVSFNYVGSDGYRMFASDQRADTHPTDVNATYPSIAYQPNGGFAIAWQADRTAGSSLHDIYMRYFDFVGNPIGTGCFAGGVQCNINSSTADATLPGIASDASSNVLLAWEEFSGNDGTIWLRKFSPTGDAIAGAVQVNTITSPPTERHEASIGVSNAKWCSVANQPCTQDTDCPSGQTCDAGTIVVAWWERQSDGTQPEKLYRRLFRNNNSLTPLDSQQVRVNTPPGFPLGAQRAARVGVATDASDNFVVTFAGTANDPTQNYWNVFAHTASPGAVTVKPDFRVDLAPRRAGLQSARVARSAQPGKFAYAWRDSRTGAFDVYTRVAPSLP